ncbi:hypothetical protein BC833DRAFT_601295 [Globomyces pollinis-pini]|nr:hypothetical protein BC833DRAFT_601295 [Globomyces pollinis-pini]
MPPGTSSRNPPRTGLQSRMNVIDRPTTQQGLGGIRLKTQGPGRQVQDSTFFQTELRQKLNMITEEIYRLNTELENTNKENSNYMIFEKKADGLAVELRDLQGQLGDLNTLVDKLHTDTDLEEFEREYHQLLAKNQRTTQALDDIFLQRQQRESAIRDVEKQIQEEEKRAEDQIEALDAGRRKQYHVLKGENNEYLASIQAQQMELEKIETKAKMLQDEVGKDVIKQKAMSLYQRLSEVRDKKRDLEASLQSSELESGPQERARLLEQVKNDNLETSGMERRTLEIEEQIRSIKEQLLHTDTTVDPQQAEKLAKYEELLKKDEEMQQFLDTFEEKKTEKISLNEATEKEIVKILGRIQILSKHDLSVLPSKQEFKDLNTDLTIKETEMRNAETTTEALTQERDQRMQDLEKVGQLEVKLKAELDHLTERIENMKKSLESIGDLETVKNETDISQAKRSAERDALRINRNIIKSEIQTLNAQYEAKRAQLLENETFTQLGALEQRLRHFEGITFELRDFIASKTAESQYKPLSKDVLKLMDEVNGQLLKIMQMSGGR